jgi:hypothetical protein
MTSKRKKSRSIINASQFFGGIRLGGLVSSPVLWILGATAALMVASQFYWDRLQLSVVVPDKEFLISEETIKINQPETWIGHSPEALIKTEFLSRPRSLLEPNLVGELAGYLKSWPFVESIESIVKSKQGVNVKLTYRQPVAIVEWKTAQQVNRRYVDRSGQVLPLAFNLPQEASNQLAIINVPDPKTSNLIDWSIWPDSRIVDAAKIAQAIGSELQTLGFRRIVTFRHGRQSNEPFELWTRAGGKVIWSDDPTNDSPAVIEQRLNQIKSWVEANGTLDQLAGWKKIDVRTGTATLVDDVNDVAEKTSLWNELK